MKIEPNSVKSFLNTHPIKFYLFLLSVLCTEQVFAQIVQIDTKIDVTVRKLEQKDIAAENSIEFVIKNNTGQLIELPSEIFYETDPHYFITETKKDYLVIYPELNQYSENLEKWTNESIEKYTEGMSADYIFLDPNEEFTRKLDDSLIYQPVSWFLMQMPIKENKYRMRFHIMLRCGQAKGIYVTNWVYL